MISSEQQVLPSAPVLRIMAAASFAARVHAQQKRKGAAAEPYINHLIEVAELVAASGHESDVNLIMACFLHDVVEDTPVTPREIAELFGDDVASLVMEVTDDKTLPKEIRKTTQVETACEKSPRAQTLKIADKISNLRSMLTSPPRDWDAKRKIEYFHWAQAVVSGFTSPNPYLLREFEETFRRISEIK